MHCKYGVVETENWLNIQRCAVLSYRTIGSPSLLVWQPPPKPDHSVLPAVGPATSAPVDLLKIANEVFTHCTYWVAPTVPSVSGGALVTLKPYCPFSRPSKLCVTGGVGGATVPTWITGSSCPAIPEEEE